MPEVKSKVDAIPGMREKINAISDDQKWAFTTKLPTVPGVYTDREGEIWLRTEDGFWYDHTGHCEPKEYNFILAINMDFQKKPCEDPECESHGD